MSEEPKSRLLDLEVEEVSFVDRAANRRRFLLLKRDEMSKEEILKVALEADLENESEIESFITEHEVDDEAGEAIRAMARLLTSYADGIDDKVMKNLGPALGFESIKEDPPVDDNKKPDTRDLPPEARKQIEALWKKAEETSQERDDLAERIASIEEERKVMTFVKKASTFGNLPIAAEELGPILKEMSEGISEDSATKIEELLASLDKAIRSGDLFSEMGSAGINNAGSALASVQAKAAEIKKSDPTVNDAEALKRVMSSDPELAKRYSEESRGR